MTGHAARSLNRPRQRLSRQRRNGLNCHYLSIKESGPFPALAAIDDRLSCTVRFVANNGTARARAPTQAATPSYHGESGGVGGGGCGGGLIMTPTLEHISSTARARDQVWKLRPLRLIAPRVRKQSRWRPHFATHANCTSASFPSATLGRARRGDAVVEF